MDDDCELKVKGTQYEDHLEIFEEIIVEVAADDDEDEEEFVRTMPRRSSLGNHETKRQTQQRRRHSSYEGIERMSFQEALKENAVSTKREEFIDNLMQVNNCVQLAWENEEGNANITPSLQYECPILSYLEDEDDCDSIELSYKHRPGLAQQENNNDDDFVFQEDEFTVPLKTPESASEFHQRAANRSSSRRRSQRQQHSYQIVRDQLELGDMPYEIAHKLFSKGSIYELSQPDLPSNPFTYTIPLGPKTTIHTTTKTMKMKASTTSVVIPTTTTKTMSSSSSSRPMVVKDLQQRVPNKPQQLPVPRQMAGVARGA